MNGTLNVGDRVCYSGKFLRSTGQVTGRVPFARGVVKEVIDYGQGWRIALIDWGVDIHMPESVNVANLSIVHQDKGIPE